MKKWKKKAQKPPAKPQFRVYDIASALYHLVQEKEGKARLTDEQRKLVFTQIEKTREELGLPAGTGIAALWRAHQARLEENIRKNEELIRKLNAERREINAELKRRELRRLEGKRKALSKSFEEIKKRNPQLEKFVSKTPMPEPTERNIGGSEEEEKERARRLRRLLSGSGV